MMEAFLGSVGDSSFSQLVDNDLDKDAKQEDVELKQDKKRSKRTTRAKGVQFAEDAFDDEKVQVESMSRKAVKKEEAVKVHVESRKAVKQEEVMETEDQWLPVAADPYGAGTDGMDLEIPTKRAMQRALQGFTRRGGGKKHKKAGTRPAKRPSKKDDSETHCQWFRSAVDLCS